MLSLRRRAEFAGGRLLLRHALEVCHPGVCHPGPRWRLVALPGQAPRLEAMDGTNLAPVVSIAHSAGVVACAVSESRRLGVDLELGGARKRDLAALAPATLHPSELEEMARLPASQSPDFFLRCWTLKEALAKALGEGLSLPFREFAFSGQRLVAAPAAWAGMHDSWYFAHPDAGPGVTLGLAWTSAGNESVSLLVQEVGLQQLAKTVAR